MFLWDYPSDAPSSFVRPKTHLTFVAQIYNKLSWPKSQGFFAASLKERSAYGKLFTLSRLRTVPASVGKRCCCGGWRRFLHFFPEAVSLVYISYMPSRTTSDFVLPVILQQSSSKSLSSFVKRISIRACFGCSLGGRPVLGLNSSPHLLPYIKHALCTVISQLNSGLVSNCHIASELHEKRRFLHFPGRRSA